MNTNESRPCVSHERQFWGKRSQKPQSQCKTRDPRARSTRCQERLQSPPLGQSGPVLSADGVPAPGSSPAHGHQTPKLHHTKRRKLHSCGAVTISRSFGVLDLNVSGHRKETTSGGCTEAASGSRTVVCELRFPCAGDKTHRGTTADSHGCACLLRKGKASPVLKVLVVKSAILPLARTS